MLYLRLGELTGVQSDQDRNTGVVAGSVGNPLDVDRTTGLGDQTTGGSPDLFYLLCCHLVSLWIGFNFIFSAFGSLWEC